MTTATSTTIKSGPTPASTRTSAAGNARFANLLVVVDGAVPLALLAWDARRGQLGANPINFAICTTGMLALIFLPLSLLVTPLRKLTGWGWLFPLRRTLGLYAFLYAGAHFLLFFAADRGFDVESTLSEMIRRPYLLVGSAALLAMAPLAATSTKGMVKRLGAKRWQALHRLAYFSAAAGALHYYMQVKADTRQPTAFAGAIAALLAYRAIGATRRRMSSTTVRRATP